MTASQYLGLSGPFRFENPKGGNVQIADKADVFVPESIPWPPSGIGLGPLVVGTQPGETVWLDQVSYAPSRSALPELDVSSAVALPTLVGASIGDDSPDKETATRREVLGIAGGFVTAGLLAGRATGASGRLDVARLHIGGAPSGVDANPAGVQISVLDAVADVLPFGATFSVFANGTEVGTFEPAADESLVLSAGTTGSIVVAVTGGLGILDNIQSALGDIWGGEEALHVPLELPQSAATYPTDAEVVLSSSDLVTGPFAEAEVPGSTTLTIGDASIPHVDEHQSGRGFYQLVERTNTRELVYTVGPEAPDATRADLRIGVGTLDELQNDLAIWQD